MLFASMKSDGTLVIRATDEIESYALKQWDKSHKAGNVKLVIETGETFSIEETTKAIGKDVAAFRKWYDDQSNRAVIPELSKVVSKEGGTHEKG